MKTNGFTEKPATKAKKPNGKTPPQATDTNGPKVKIPYDEGVRLGKEIVARDIDGGWWRLCELAEQLEPEYGERTRDKYFYDVGVGRAGPRRFTVWRCYQDPDHPDGISALGPISYTAARWLATHPDRWALFEQNPAITPVEARDTMSAYWGKWGEHHLEEEEDDDALEEPTDDEEVALEEPTGDGNEEDADSDQADGTVTTNKTSKGKDWREKHNKKWDQHVLAYASVAEDLWHTYPSLAFVREHMSVRSLPQVRQGALALCLLYRRLKKDLSATETDETLAPVVSAHQAINDA